MIRDSVRIFVSYSILGLKGQGISEKGFQATVYCSHALFYSMKERIFNVTFHIFYTTLVFHSLTKAVFYLIEYETKFYH